MPTPLSGVLVTATPMVQGYPIISGYTNDQGQVTLPLNPTLQYNLTFSGPAMGTVPNFIPKNATFYFYVAKNVAPKSVSISGKKIKPTSFVYVLPGKYKIKPATTVNFSKWIPGQYFSNSTVSSTMLKAFASISISFKSKSPLLKMYVIDGSYKISVSTAGNNVYNPSTNTWSAKANDLQPQLRTGLVAGVIGSKIYAVDGEAVHPRTSGGYSTSWVGVNHAYDPSTNTWSAKASDDLKRGFIGAGVIGSKLYAVDGHGANYYKNNHAYDPATNTWSNKASDTLQRSGLAAGVIGSKMYAVDGYVFNVGDTGANHAYDPTTNTWSAKASDPKPRSEVAGGVLESKMYTIDGVYSVGLATNNAYDPATNTWSNKASDLKKRAGPATGVIGSKMYVVDGVLSSVYLAINHAYDPSTNTWSTKASDLTKRFWPATGVVT